MTELFELLHEISVSVQASLALKKIALISRRSVPRWDTRSMGFVCRAANGPVRACWERAAAAT